MFTFSRQLTRRPPLSWLAGSRPPRTAALPASTLLPQYGVRAFIPRATFAADSTLGIPDSVSAGLQRIRHPHHTSHLRVGRAPPHATAMSPPHRSPTTLSPRASPCSRRPRNRSSVLVARMLCPARRTLCRAQTAHYPFPRSKAAVRNTVYYNGKARVYTCRGCNRDCLSALLTRPRHHLVSREANTGARAIRWMALASHYTTLLKVCF